MLLFFTRFQRGTTAHASHPALVSQRASYLVLIHMNPRFILQRNLVMRTLVHFVECHENNAKDKMIRTTEIYFLTVLQTGKSKIKVFPSLASVEHSSLAFFSPSRHTASLSRIRAYTEHVLWCLLIGRH